MGVCCTRDENAVYSYDFEHFWVYKIYQTKDYTLWSVYPMQINVQIETFYQRKESVVKTKINSEPFTIDFRNMIHTSDVNPSKKTNIRRVNRGDITIKIFREKRASSKLFISGVQLVLDLTAMTQNVHLTEPFKNNTITADNTQRFIYCKEGLLSGKFKQYKSVEKLHKSLKKTAKLVCGTDELQRTCYFNEIAAINQKNVFQQVIKLYTMEGILYDKLHEELGTKDSSLTRQIELFYILLQAAIIEESVLQKDMLRGKLKLSNCCVQLFRGCVLSEEIVGSYRNGIGSIRYFNDFISTTYDLNNAVINSTSQVSGDDAACVFVFNIDFDRACFAFIEDLSYYAVEKEVLITAGCLFKVTSVQEDRGVTRIELDLVSDGSMPYDYLSYSGSQEARVACLKDAEGDRLMLHNIIKFHKGLVKLTLRQCWITDKHGALICNALRYNNTLRDLDLSYNQMSDEIAPDFGLVFAENKALERLNLCQNRFTTMFVEQIVEPLKGNTTLKDLNLYAAKLGDKGADLISDLLRFNKSLRSIDLNQTGIGDIGLEHICEVLKINTYLEELSIRKNGITDLGIEKLCEIIKITHTLRFIDMGENNITKVSGSKLADALKENKSLYSISLDRTEIGEEGVKEIINVIKNKDNVTLRELYLAENNLDESIIPEGIVDVRIKLKKEF
jgi:hypothetical protein